MTSEEILLQMPNVKHKKDDGTLYILSERLTWFHKDTMQMSHKYSDIKSQKISPEGKPKIQLQIVLYDNSTFTFHFVNPSGAQGQYIDRDQVKELLMQLLPKFRRKINRELEEKNRLLSENPELLQLYKDLVIENIITSDEFWTIHAQQYMTNPAAATTIQETGVSSGFLSNIHPETDGANGIRYNLTTDVITSIFKTYPAVKRKHIECVPAEMTESQFWTKFFQSHYFHRDRLPQPKELFSDCAKVDDKEMKKEIERVGPYFAQEDGEPQPLGSITEGVHKNMIKRFNHHSIMVLKACDKNSAIPKKKQKLDNFEDLSEPKNRTDTKLHLTKVDRYLNGPIADHRTEVVTPEMIISTSQQMRECLMRWGTKPVLLDAVTAVKILDELRPGGALMADLKLTNEHQLPPELKSEIRNAYLSLTELLRHYYSCYPPSTPILEEKLKKSYETLKKFESVKLNSLKDRVLQYHLSSNLLDHIKSVLLAAYDRFGMWNGRKGRR